MEWWSENPKLTKNAVQENLLGGGGIIPGGIGGIIIMGGGAKVGWGGGTIPVGGTILGGPCLIGGRWKAILSTQN